MLSSGMLGFVTIRVRESVSGNVVNRDVTFSSLLVAGPPRADPHMANAPPERGNIRKRPIDQGKLAEAVQHATRQAHLWESREQELPEGYRVRWRFTHRVEVTADVTPVHDIFRSQAGDGPFIEDDRDREQRSHRDMWDEARRRGCDNVIIIHPSWHEAVTLRQDPHSLEFRIPHGWNGHFQDVAGNVIHLGFERISAQGSGTIAHEMGHCMGLGHAPFDGQPNANTRIMFGTLTPGVTRAMSASDLLLLDDVLDVLGPSDGIEFMGPRPPLPQPDRRRRSRPHRRRVR